MKTEKVQHLPTANNHSIDDILIVRNKLYGHHFKIGTKVTVEDVRTDDYRCTDGKECWYMADQNFMTKNQLKKKTP